MKIIDYDVFEEDLKYEKTCDFKYYSNDDAFFCNYRM